MRAYRIEPMRQLPNKCFYGLLSSQVRSYAAANWANDRYGYLILRIRRMCPARVCVCVWVPKQVSCLTSDHNGVDGILKSKRNSKLAICVEHRLRLRLRQTAPRTSYPFPCSRRHLQLRLPTLMTMMTAAAMAFVAQHLSRHCDQLCAHVSLFGIPRKRGVLPVGYTWFKEVYTKFKLSFISLPSLSLKRSLYEEASIYIIYLIEN